MDINIEEKENKIKCILCGKIHEEEDLLLYNHETNKIVTLDEIYGYESLEEACPNCKTIGHLMDLKE